MRLPHPIWLLRLALLLAAGVTVFMYFPGGLGGDQINMLEQAQTGRLNDWYGYTLPMVWRVGLLFADGPVSMLVLNVGVHFLGFYLLAASVMRMGRLRLAWAIAALSVFPLTHIMLVEAGSRDGFLSAFLLVAFGCAVRVADASGWRRWAWAATAVALLALCIGIRQNAFFAVVPIAAFLGASRGKRAMALAVVVTLIAAGAFRAAVYATHEVSKTNVLLSLLVFDLGAIAHASNEDVAEGILGDDFVTQAHACYTAFWWDELSEWGKCSGVWKAFTGERYGPKLDEATLSERQSRLLSAWGRAVRAHPRAYWRHRVTHFYLATRVRCAFCDTPLSSISFFEEGSQSTGRAYPALARGTDAASRWLAPTVLGKPWVWMVMSALAVALSFRWRRDPMFPWIVALGVSGVLYTLGFAAVGVAGMVRYFHWSVTSGGLALCLQLGTGLHNRLW